MRTSILAVFALMGIASMGVTGCATQSYVQKQVAQVQEQVELNQARITNLQESDAEQNEKLTELSATAQDALARAEKLARGKFLYEVTLTADSIQFGFNKTRLSEDARSSLEALASSIKSANRNAYVEIQGHTDSIGSEKFNLRLGLARAKAVLGYLHTEQGFPLHRMNVFSYGESKPIADNSTPAGRAKNRRVTLVVIE